MTDRQLAVLYCNFQYQEITVQFTFRLLPEYYYVDPPPLIFTCIGFNVTNTSKENQKITLQNIVKMMLLSQLINHLCICP